jgi:hypothetical protein
MRLVDGAAKYVKGEGKREITNGRQRARAKTSRPFPKSRLGSHCHLEGGMCNDEVQPRRSATQTLTFEKP